MPRIPVFVINLDRRGDRMEQMHKRLGGVAYSRISAVDGRDLGPEERMQAEQARLTPNEYACLQSHINVLKRLGEDNLQHACVLEDDVVLAADFSSFMDDAAWIPPRAGLIKIETMKSKVWLDRSSVAARDRQLFRLRSNHSGTAGYVVSREFAPHLVRMLATLEAAADDVMFRTIETDADYQVLQLRPALCIQEFIVSGENTGSDIAAGRKTLRSSLAAPKTARDAVVRKLIKPFRQVSGAVRRLRQLRAVVPFQ